MPINPSLKKTCTHSDCDAVCEVLVDTRIFWVTCLAAPLQIDGHIDGTVFYFRQRHGGWRIELPQYSDLIIVSGSRDDYYPIGEAVEMITTKVVEWMYPHD